MFEAEVTDASVVLGQYEAEEAAICHLGAVGEVQLLQVVKVAQILKTLVHKKRLRSINGFNMPERSST